MTEIFLEVLIARVLAGLLKSNTAAAALARLAIVCIHLWLWSININMSKRKRQKAKAKAGCLDMESGWNAKLNKEHVQETFYDTLSPGDLEIEMGPDLDQNFDSLLL